MSAHVSAREECTPCENRMPRADKGVHVTRSNDGGGVQGLGVQIWNGSGDQVIGTIIYRMTRRGGEADRVHPRLSGIDPIDSCVMPDSAPPNQGWRQCQRCLRYITLEIEPYFHYYL
jgi:hypothetical protein